jgi:PhnB protein
MMPAAKSKTKPKNKSAAKMKAKSNKKPAAKTKARASKPTPIPPGYRTITPHLTVKGAKAAIAFYKAAFGAKDRGTMLSPDGSVMHSSLQIGDSIVMLNDEFPQAKSPSSLRGTPVTIHVYVNNADQAWKKALSAGAKVIMPMQDMFWGDRYGVLVDPFGHMWSIASRKEVVSMRELNRRMASMGSGPPSPNEIEAESITVETQG